MTGVFSAAHGIMGSVRCSDGGSTTRSTHSASEAGGGVRDKEEDSRRLPQLRQLATSSSRVC